MHAILESPLILESRRLPWVGIQVVGKTQMTSETKTCLDAALMSPATTLNPRDGLNMSRNRSRLMTRTKPTLKLMDKSVPNPGTNPRLNFYNFAHHLNDETTPLKRRIHHVDPLVRAENCGEIDKVNEIIS